MNAMLTETQYAEKHGISRFTIRRLIESGRLEAVDFGTKGQHLFRIRDEAVPTPLPTAFAPAVMERRPRRVLHQGTVDAFA